MGVNVTNYQCPNCTGPMHFDGTTGKLVCDYCDSAFTVEEIEAMFGAKEDAAAEKSAEAETKAQDEFSQADAETMNVRSYSCPTCGAELICDETTIATSCPYCGNPSVTPGPFIHARKPDYIIPFKFTREQAVEALKNHYKGKKLLPKAFADNNHIEEIKGVYVPFWLYDGSASANITYQATRSKTTREGDFKVTRTEHFNVLRNGIVRYEKVPVDGSEKMPDTHMDAIEPFDYADLKPFSTAYLPGFLADKYDQDENACRPRAEKRFVNTAEQIMYDSVKGYDTVEVSTKTVNVKRRAPSYALFPVWMLSTNWNGTNYLFAMNGQTGKLIGDLPVDMAKYWTYFAGIAAGVAAVLSALMFLI